MEEWMITEEKKLLTHLNRMDNDRLPKLAL
jgi:hypothetical protein